MAKFFISYRRNDSQHQADRLHSALSRYVADPKHDIFIDVDNIPYGVDFVEYLDGKVRQCEVLLALIGDRWLEADPATGLRRIDDPRDFVRIEIVSALKRGIPVVPVLLDGVSIPDPDDLPDDLKSLSQRNGVPVQRLSFDADIARMINGLPIDLTYRANETSSASSPNDGGAAKMWGGIEHSLDPRDYQEFKEHFSNSKWAFEAGRRIRQLKDWSEIDQNNANRISEFRKNALDIAPLFEALDNHTQKVMRRANDRTERSRDHSTSERSNGSAIADTDKETVPHSGRIGLVVGGLFAISIVAIGLWWLFDSQFWDWGEANYQPPAVETAETEIEPATDTTLGSGSLYDIVDAPSDRLSSIMSGEVVDPAQFASYGAELGDPVHLRGFQDCEICPEMVAIPSGTFTLGSPEDEAGRGRDESPRQTINIDDQLAIGKHEVTWAEWDLCVLDGGCDGAGPEIMGGDEGWGRAKRPVINVSWEDAQSYVRWLRIKTGANYRLPSEAEWEYVARAGSSTAYSWGDAIGSNQATCYECGDRFGFTAPVGAFDANAFGVYDVHGNVAEWVEDCYQDSYSGAPTDGSPRTETPCSRRVVRGGSWANKPEDLRSANRSSFSSDARDNNLGFRVARQVPR